jgi:hypothetical protein
MIHSKSTVDDSPPRWRRYTWRFLWLLLFLAMVAGGRAWYLYSRSNSALQKAIDATAAADPRWRIEDIIADWPAIPDDKNSALVVLAGNQLIDQSKKTLPNDDEDNEPPPPNCQMNEAQLKRLAADLAPYEKAVVEYRKIASLPSGTYPMAGVPTTSSLLFRSSPIRESSMALRNDLWHRLIANDDLGAAIALKAAINVPCSLGDEAFAITVMVRGATLRIAIDCLERWLGMSQPSDAVLAEVQQMLEREAADPIMLRCARAERAFAFFTTGDIPATMPKPTNPWEAIQRTFEMTFTAPGFIAEQQTAILTHMNAFVAVTQSPQGKFHTQLLLWQTAANNSPVLMKLIVPAVMKTVEAIQKAKARTQCAIVAIAAERFRRQHGQWPTTLDELVKAKLISAVPIDPFDCQPLQWKIVPEGRVIYPIGNDKLGDSLGPVTSAKNDRMTIEFRLYDPDKRRLPPRPPKSKSTSDEQKVEP